MNHMAPLRQQRGVTLIVGLIMLVLLTMVVTTAFTLSTTNLKAVGNMQFRDEAIGAANAAIEQVISSDVIFIAPLAARIIVVGDYSVEVDMPECLYAVDVIDNSGADPNPNILIEGAPGGGGAATSFQDTYWDIAARVNDARSGASVVTRQGVKITLPSNPNPCP